ncbi:ABC transporter ATP-binding protein [Niveispirillum sp. KHB5.9]|uniref:ABC transporter ATP-binding protein n=1 Tax=Niveispirillum sp. KHB5.9 TaxID=3400269 RepID=UPI003A8AC074
MSMKNEAMVALDNVSMRFGPRPGPLARLGLTRAPDIVQAVRDVTLDIRPGEVLGLVGESGCGKSTLGRVVAGLYRPSAGRLLVEGRDPWTLPAGEAKALGLGIQMIFQDPMASLNPRLRIRRIIGEAAQAHGIIDGGQMADYVAGLMRRVGLDPAMMERFPHEFSGGQRQRVGIARALAVKPRLLVCDESVAALDVSVQAQILNLFMELRQELGLTYLFISHDLAVVRHISDRVAVMYLGRVVERGPAEELFDAPLHPYSRALVGGALADHVGKRRFTGLKGEIPSPLRPPSGCAFHPRCPIAVTTCHHTVPAMADMAPGYRVACHLAPASSREVAHA